MSNYTRVKQEDGDLIEAIAEPWICVEEPPCEDTESVHWEEMLTSLTATLATVRREAFKDAQGMMDAPAPGTMASTEFHKGFESMRRLAKRVLERAALEASATEGRNNE